MPVAVNVSYPGVYIQEIPSGSRTITGVSTSIAAFIGWAAKGNTDKAQRILSWQDFQREYGGLDNRSYLGYAVSQFFANGGQQAYVVRLANTGSSTASENATSAKVTLDTKLIVTAKNPGVWGNDYAIVTKKLASPNNDRFQLTVVNYKVDTAGKAIEVFENLSIKQGDSRFVVDVLANESFYVSAKLVSSPTEPPADTDIPNTGKIPEAAKLVSGADGLAISPQKIWETDTDTKSAFISALLPSSGIGGINYLDRVDLFNILSVPGLSEATSLGTLEKYSQKHRAFLIVDSAKDARSSTLQNDGPKGLTGEGSANAAYYFPWIVAPDPLSQNRPRAFPPSGFVAGIYARTDANRGIWKAPAGTEASLTGAIGLAETLTDGENGVLNKKAINSLRNFDIYGPVVWGSRTLQGNDEIGSEWKYIPVRRTALFIEESLFRALKWVVFEPNDEPLWAQIRLNVGAFLNNLFRQGAFQGKTPQEAYFVKVDKETTTQNDINLGIINIAVGFAPLKPAEFVVIQIQQIAGQLST